MEEIAAFLQGAIDGTEFELKASRRRETTLMHREPGQRTMSTDVDTEILGRVACGQLRKTYEQGTWHSGEWGERLRITPVYGVGIGERSTSSLRALLQGYVDSEGGHVGHALVDCVEGRFFSRVPSPGFRSEEKVSTLEDFRDYLTVAAAVLGVDRVAGHVGAWINGGPVQYHAMALLVGVRLDEPLMLNAGIGIERLSTRSGGLPESLPGFGSETPETYLGGVVLSVDCEAAPGLFKPTKRPGGDWEFADDVRHGWVLEGSSIDAFCESLSLGYDGCIRCKETWRDYGELREFSELRSRSYEPARIVEAKLPQTVLTQSALEEGWELQCRRTGRKAQDGIGTAIGRWVKSKRPEASLADRFIDLRIALEALYLDGDSERDKSRRIAKRGAWYAGGSSEARSENHAALRAAYRVSSAAVHAGALVDCDSNRDLLKTVQSLCRAGIVKRLAEDGNLKWKNRRVGG